MSDDDVLALRPVRILLAGTCGVVGHVNIGKFRCVDLFQLEPMEQNGIGAEVSHLRRSTARSRHAAGGEQLRKLNIPLGNDLIRPVVDRGFRSIRPGGHRLCWDRPRQG